MLAGDKCVLMKERGVMVIGLSLLEYQLLLENRAGTKMEVGAGDKMEVQMISGLRRGGGFRSLAERWHVGPELERMGAQAVRG